MAEFLTTENTSLGLDSSSVFDNSSIYGFENSSYVPYNKRPETYIVPAVFAIIFVVGTIGNGVLIFMFVRNKSLRSIPNTYIISLALGDLLVLFFTVPFVSTIYTIDYWPYGSFECKFSDFMRDISVGVTVFNLTALSADRYLAIVSPVRKATSTAANFTVKTAVGIWILSIALSVPSSVFSHVRQFNLTSGVAIDVCFPFPEWFSMWHIQVIVMTKFLVYYFIPLTIIATFYLMMARHLYTTADNFPITLKALQRQVKTRRKIAKIVLCFVFIFAICFLPNHVFILWFYFDPDSSSKYGAFWHIFRIIGFCLSFFNSCINPIALYCISGTFRKQYNKYLCRCFHKEGLHRSSSLSRRMTPRGSRYNSTIRGTETIVMSSLLPDRPNNPL